MNCGESPMSCFWRLQLLFGEQCQFKSVIFFFLRLSNKSCSKTMSHHHTWVLLVLVYENKYTTIKTTNTRLLACCACTSTNRGPQKWAREMRTKPKKFVGNHENQKTKPWRLQRTVLHVQSSKYVCVGLPFLWWGKPNDQFGCASLFSKA